NVVESYRLVNNFHEGTDTVVISLRDDVDNVRTECATPVDNLLYQAGQLDLSASAGVPGWETTGCATQTTGGVTTPIPNCVSAYQLDADTSAGPFPDLNPDLGKVRGYTVV